MSHMPAALRRFVTQRAANKCEYCGLSQISQIATFHIDHVIPVAAGGETTEDNLALACVSCSLRKGARLTVIDPLSGTDALIYNPREQSWHDHFRWERFEMVGITATGRATVAALAMNRATVLLIREEESSRGRHPLP